MIRIENKRFTAKVRARGAELASLKEKSTGREFIWQADPAIWGGSAPILFPIVGKLKDGQTLIDERPYAIPKHGVLRTRDAELVAHETDRARLRFESNAETLAVYPFAFRFTVEFRLLDDGLDVTYEVENPDTAPLLFSIGSHPAFALDLESRGIDEYTIEFSEPETLDLYGLRNGTLAKIENDYLRGEKTIRLTPTLFEEDALIFKDIQSRGARLEPLGLEIGFRDHPHVGIWAKPNAPYVCVEPWFTFDDTADGDGVFANKPGVMELEASGRFETGYTLRID